MTRRTVETGRAGCDPVVVTAVRAACQALDGRALRTVLGANVTAVVDGGGVVPAPVVPIRGTAEVADYLLGLVTQHPEPVLSAQPVNGGTGIVVASGGRVVGIVSLGTRSGRVDELFIVLNPAKLRAWNPE